MYEDNDIKIDFLELVKTDNIATLLTEDQQKKVGRKVIDWYEVDDVSRTDWKTKNKGAMKLAMQVVEKKTYPWPNASNVKFPLLTMAALQFSARVYPALVKVPDLVKQRIVGADPNGQKASRASRVSKYMSYQLLDEDETWEENHDKLMIALPIAGCMFKKTVYDPLIQRNRSSLVFPENLVIHYYAKDLENSRVTELFELYPSRILERQLMQLYIKYEIGPGDPSNKIQREEQDARQGIAPPPGDEETPRDMLESHCFWDFDGDGLSEPYIITVDKQKGIAVRIKHRFKKIVSQQSLKAEQIQKLVFQLAQSVPNPQILQGLPKDQQQQAFGRIKQVEAKINGLKQEQQLLLNQPPDLIRIEPKVHYTKYPFIPAPDGGFYDLGFGQLLAPINESVDTLINQLLDAGTLQVGAQGFIGKGARIQGGRMAFQPFEWKRVNVSGATLKESLVPLPVNAPSPVLFQLLGLLIQYAERVGSVSDIMVGENPGQNTPAYNMSAMLEQGSQVFNGIFKRIYRSFRSELRKLYDLNAEFLDPETYFETMDGDFKVLQQDFQGDPKDLIPAADPNAFSNTEKMMKAQFLAQRAAMVPGYNPVAVEKRLLEGMDVPDVDEVYPLKSDGTWAIPPPPNPELEIDKADMQRRVIEGKIRGETDAARASAEIHLKEAQVQQIFVEIQSAGKPDATDQLKLIQEQMKTSRENAMAKIDVLMKSMEMIQQAQEHQHEMALMDKEMEVESAKAESQKKIADSKTKVQKKKETEKPKANK